MVLKKKQTGHFKIVDKVTKLYQKAPEKIFNQPILSFVPVSNYNPEPRMVIFRPHL